jgi:hypothetical protein
MDRYRRTCWMAFMLLILQSISIFTCGSTLVYAAPVNNEEAHCIVGSCQDYPQLPQHLWMMKRVEACTESHGQHSEEYLLYMYSFGHSSQIELIPKVCLHCLLTSCIQSVPGWKVNILGGHSISHSMQIYTYMCRIHCTVPKLLIRKRDIMYCF